MTDKFVSFDSFMRYVNAAFPGAVIENDPGDGELVIHTGLIEIEDGEVMSFADAGVERGNGND